MSSIYKTVYLWHGGAGVAIALVGKDLARPELGQVEGNIAYGLEVFAKYSAGDTGWIRQIEQWGPDCLEIMIESGENATAIQRIVRGLGCVRAWIRTGPPLTPMEATLAIVEHPIPVVDSERWQDLTEAARRQGEIDLCEMALAMACAEIRRRKSITYEFDPLDLEDYAPGVRDISTRRLNGQIYRWVKCRDSPPNNRRSPPRPR